ncbi:DNA-binding protein HEXBP [Biomphalaria glabrata]|nr:DNA-binding protein HEXBP [Biomphalaria glabrata]
MTNELAMMKEQESVAPLDGVPTLDKIVRVCFCLINPFTVNASPDEDDDVRHVKTLEEMGIDLNILMIPSLEGS